MDKNDAIFAIKLLLLVSMWTMDCSMLLFAHIYVYICLFNF
jgi:hypothetical protein